MVTTSTAWSSSSDFMTRLCSASTSTGWVVAAGAFLGSAKGTPLRMDWASPVRRKAAVPVRVKCAQPCGGSSVGWQAKEANRRNTPFRPIPCLVCGADEPPQPAHRARRAGIVIITGPRKYRNRQHARQGAPLLPLMELGHSVLAHQPYEAMPRIALHQPGQRIDRVAGSIVGLEVAHLDAAAPGHGARRGEAGAIGRHVPGLILQRVSGGNQPPDFV